MLRDTMMSTIPVAMMAIEVLWTERFHRLRAVRKSPPDRMWKAIQIAASDDDHADEPRVDLGRRQRRAPRPTGPVAVSRLVTAEASGVSTVVMQTPPGL